MYQIDVKIALCTMNSVCVTGIHFIRQLKSLREDVILKLKIIDIKTHLLKET